ncbi:unannotated protein [freshwater metagenome]|uniref:Unannotated protein n=1 Tax=freshwater metagenome TaxID=449393 RepID=A0A6J6QZM7_9ZZZZ
MGLGILAQHSVVVLGTVSSLVMEHLGLLGLADSGHAGLFIALTGLDASTASEKVLGVVASPDERLDQLAAMSKSRQVVPATFQIAYLPGLSTEAGKGLGSRLLGGVRDCDALMMVVRADEGHDPAQERTAIEEELILADLGTVENRLAKQQRAAKGDKSLAAEIAALSRAEEVLSAGTPIYRSDLTPAECNLLTPAFLLTNKPTLLVVNIGLDQLAETDLGIPEALSVCIELESDPDVVATSGVARAELLADLGIPESVVPRLARQALELLGRSTFLTTGEEESRAWTFRTGAMAPECAGAIHSDLQRGFIRAEVIDWQELLKIGSWSAAKDVGKLRVEGKDYEVLDGEVLEIRFNI